MYSETEAPVALIKPSVVYTDRWRELPDGPAVLPNGTQCKIEAKLATGSVIQADGRRLKQVLIRVLDAIKSEKIAAEYEQKVWPIDVESDSLPDVEVQQLGLSADGSTQLEL